ncbi:Unknown protein [Striga hermonthica]|uniref:Uncharacterized protein n=1 Tax=Striga hermonthica TaxID=68872 RepID=A0A9N7QZE2_STRHE|nr:Unknown protein [Striga hermonthica]
MSIRNYACQSFFGTGIVKSAKYLGLTLGIGAGRPRTQPLLDARLDNLKVASTRTAQRTSRNPGALGRSAELVRYRLRKVAPRVGRSTDVKCRTAEDWEAGRSQHISGQEKGTIPAEQGNNPEPFVQTNQHEPGYPVSSQIQTKAYARRAQYAGERVLHASHRPIPEHATSRITFSDEDAFLFDHPHSDALVITDPIATIKVHRIMVDTGAYASIMYLSTFKKMKIDIKEVQPCNDRIQGFNGTTTLPLGQITLPVKFGGNGQPARTIMEVFKIVDCESEYNAVLGRTALYKLRAAVSIFHYSIQFPISEEERVHRGHQREARECILAIPHEEINTIEILDDGLGKTVAMMAEVENEQVAAEAGDEETYPSDKSSLNDGLTQPDQGHDHALARQRSFTFPADENAAPMNEEPEIESTRGR